MVETAFLADHLDTIPTLAEWFRAQWPGYYAQRSQADLEQDFHSEANRDGLPMRLVGFSNGALVGTIVLRERALATLSDFRPGLGGLFVPEIYRAHGIGTELVMAGMKMAREQGYAFVYATTSAASNILECLGWEVVKAVVHDDEQLTLYRCGLNA